MKPEIAVVLPPAENFSPEGSGAIGLVVHHLARASTGFSPLVLGRRTALAPFGDVPFHPIAVPPWPPAPRSVRYAEAVGRALTGLAPAMIEVHNRPDVALRLSRRFASLPTVLVLHNDPTAMRGGRSRAERARLLTALAGIVSVSEFLRTRLLEGVPHGKNARVLANPIDCGAIPRGLAAEERSHVVLFAGRMVRDKGADAFVQAVEEALPELPGWRAVAYGADRFGPASPRTPFLAALTRHARAAGVTLMGYRPHREVLEAMAEAAIVVVPSRWAEPFGLTALEALGSGAALIASPRGALPEVAGEAARYADPDRPGELAAAIIALARDLPARREMGARGRARAALFDLPRVARALDALRREMLA